MQAFLSPVPLPGIRTGTTTAVSLKPSSPFQTRPRRYAALRMSTQSEDNSENDTLTPTEREQTEPAFSFWGVASFTIIMAIFALGILATVARDFVPGGMSGPA